MSSAADRVALAARQGAGARYDAAEAPSDDLLQARRATAYFARLLNGLSDAALMAPRRCGPPRALIVAQIGYQARGFAQILDGVSGQDQTAIPDQSFATSLPPRALRGLFHHSAIHLDVVWRDLPGPAWEKVLYQDDGVSFIARETPRLRAINLWRAASDLDAGARLRDVPPDLSDLLTQT